MEKNNNTLRDYQKEAIAKWFKNNKKGIFNMATGSGKTFTALECLEKFKKENRKPLLTIIACPTSHLVDQWEENLVNYNNDKIIKAYHSVKKWKNTLRKSIRHLNIGLNENIVVITTHKTFSMNNFTETIQHTMEDIFIIVDEVHGVGAKTLRQGLKKEYKYRLGLSATPTRWYDEEGTEIILNYFGDIIFNFTIRDALIKGYLTKYHYYPQFITLNNYEYYDYSELTRQIAKIFYSKKEEDKEKLENYLFKRQKIINKAENKYSKLEEILNKNPNLKNLIIYCSDRNQINKVKNILDKYNISQDNFTSHETIKKRKELKKQLQQGQLDALLAMKCLDEGIDIPSVKNAIIMASTSNPREYIQRRGRILRKTKGKNNANIYDMIVSPNTKKLNLTSEEKKIEKKILEKEIQRYREFAKDAENSYECLNKLNELY